MYKKALEEINLNIYNELNDKKIFTTQKPIINFNLDKDKYSFYKYIYSTDTSDIYKGLKNNDELVYMAMVTNENDNALIDEEYKLLNRLDHHSIPKVDNIVKINGFNSLILNNIDGLSIDEIRKEYGNISGDHLCWMLERLLSCVGYLHVNNIIHGNIKKENIFINPETHNVSLLDYSLSISNANKDSSKYRIINEDYTPKSINAKTRPNPNTDIYGVGKLAILLLGGDIKNNGMPVVVDPKLRDFIRELVREDGKHDDAWKLWHNLIELRKEVYGTERFKKLEKVRGN
jgi:serine/threonine protein kinase